MRLPLWLKIVWTVFVLCWAPVYWKQYGVQNFLFFCDLGNFLIAIALWAESPVLFSWQAVSLLVFQTIFVLDLAGAWLSGHHPIGGTEFMFDAHLPLLVRLLSLFHLVTPPLLLWAIWKLGYDRRGWKLQTLTCWVLETRDARTGVSARLSAGGAPCGLLPHTSRFAVVGETKRPSAVPLTNGEPGQGLTR